MNGAPPNTGHKAQLQLSRGIRGIPQALSIYINQIVYDLRRMNRDVIAMSLGEAFFDIPLYDFNRLNSEKGFHYSDTQGLPELREKICAYYARYYGAPVDANEIMVSAGSKAIIYMCIRAVVDPGDEILIHEPAWLSYQEHAHLAGATTRFIPFDVPVEKFHEYMSDKTKLVIINNPNNPAGRLYSRDELQSLHSQALANGTFVLVDEAYSDFVIDEPFVSMAEVVPDKQGVFVVNSLSKNMGMSGWRIGYVMTSPDVIAHLLKLNQHLITCAPTILQQYMATYFDDIIAVTLPQVRAVVEKRKRCVGMLDELGLKRLGGNCTFYFFVDVDAFPASTMEFALHLLTEKGVAVVPGSAYGASTDRFVRISIGTESDDRIWQALQMIRDLLLVKDFDGDALARRMKQLKIEKFS